MDRIDVEATPRGPRIFLGPVEVAGYYSALGRDFRALGIDAVAVDLHGNRFQYARDGERLPLAARAAAAATRRRSRATRWPGLWKAVLAIATVPLFLWAIVRFDTFVFGFRASFFGLHDLWLLRRLGKRVFFVFHGTDARPPYMDGQDMSPAAGLSSAECAALAAHKKRQIRTIERHATMVISHPLYSQFQERRYVRALALGMPGDSGRDGGPVRAPHGTRTRILHSPSNPEVKGTAEIRAAIDALTDEGLPIDYLEVVGVPNATVLREIELSDVVVDQLYSDTAMASLASEAAWRSRPSIVGSYGWDELRRLIPSEELAPVRSCHPDEAARAIRELVEDAAGREDLGRRAFDFVRERSAPGLVAARYLRVFRDDIPAEWMSDPMDVRYCSGSGLTQDRVRDVVRAIIDQSGPAALQLGDKPLLEAILVDLAFGRGSAEDGHRSEVTRS